MYFYRLSLLIILFLLLSPPSPCLADLDVGVPKPGSPLDWSLWIPSITPADSPDDDDEPSYVREKLILEQLRRTLRNAPTVYQRRNSLDPWEESGVTTVDVDAHLKWWTPGIKENDEFSSSLLRFRLTGNFVRLHLNPDALAIPDFINRMIEIGEPAYFISKTIWGNKDATDFLKPICASIGQAIGAPPKPYQPDKKASAFEWFLFDQLGQGNPYDYDPDFGYLLGAMGDTLLPQLIQVAKTHPHITIRRNTVYLLSQFHEKESTQALRDFATTSQDRVIVNRALMALLKRHDVTLIPWLIQQLQAPRFKDKYWGHMCVYVLGAMAVNNKDAVEPIIAWVQTGLESKQLFDMDEHLWTGLFALGRIGISHPKLRVWHELVLKKHKSSASKLVQASLLALAGCGDQPIITGLWNEAKKKSLKAFHSNTVGFAVEIFARYQTMKTGNRLQQLFDDTRNHIQLRYHALRLCEFDKKNVAWLREISADEEHPSLIHTCALLKLFEWDPVVSRTMAWDILNAATHPTMKDIALIPSDAPALYYAIMLCTTKDPLPMATLQALLPRCLPYSGGGYSGDNRLTQLLLFEINKQKTDKWEKQLILLISHPTGLIALALSNFDSKNVRQCLFRALKSNQPHLRYTAALSLRKITGEDGSGIEWLYGNSKTLRAGITYWKKALHFK